MGDNSSTSRRIKLRDGRFLAYREGGVPKEEAKHKIILVHYLQGSKNMNFLASQELIEELGVYFLFYDRAGYGESDSNTKRSPQSEADDIAQLADQLEIGPKFYLIGVSLGAYPIWGCLKHIPHRISGVAVVSGSVNYRWPSLPEELIKKDYRRFFIQLCLWITKYAPGLLHWWVIHKLVVSTISVIVGIAVYFNNRDTKAFKPKNSYPKLTNKKKRPATDLFATVLDDFLTCHEQWDFEPADVSISEESSVHIWHGKEDKVVPVELPRCILQKQPLIKYHEIPQAGHVMINDDGIPDAILRSLLLGEEHNL